MPAPKRMPAPKLIRLRAPMKAAKAGTRPRPLSLLKTKSDGVTLLSPASGTPPPLTEDEAAAVHKAHSEMLQEDEAAAVHKAAVPKAKASAPIGARPAAKASAPIGARPARTQSQAIYLSKSLICLGFKS